jgi:hypothetical protein
MQMFWNVVFWGRQKWKSPNRFADQLGQEFLSIPFCWPWFELENEDQQEKATTIRLPFQPAKANPLEV